MITMIYKNNETLEWYERTEGDKIFEKGNFCDVLVEIDSVKKDESLILDIVT